MEPIDLGQTSATLTEFKGFTLEKRGKNQPSSYILPTSARSMVSP
ncbi:hypothetical protein F0521_12330 [Ferrimonas sp. YFM]|nr:hypothetical protein F0521_12330 [Ferrimonas sp. YFM]